MPRGTLVGVAYRAEYPNRRAADDRRGPHHHHARRDAGVLLGGRRGGPRRPADIRLHIPQDMRVTELTRPDGAKVYDVSVSSAG